MRKSKEELTRLHKEKCRELKKIRAQIAEDLGIDLKQSECTYEGYCSGTCPKCKSEEMMLNLAIMKKQMESVDIKRKVATAGITTAAALSLSGCNLIDSDISNWGFTEGIVSNDEISPIVTEGDVEYIDASEENSDCTLSEEAEPSTETNSIEDIDGQLDISGAEIEGEIAVPESTEWELAGDIVILEESIEENTNE